MAEQDCNTLGEAGRTSNLAAGVSPFRDPPLFREIDAALHRIAEAAAHAGTGDGADWSPVHAAILDAYQLIDQYSCS